MKTMQTVRWGILGCGDVAEKKSGPALYKAHGSELVAVMRRDRAKAEDFARRHGAKRAYDSVQALLADTEVDAGLYRDASLSALRTGHRRRPRGKARSGRKADGTERRRV